MDKREYKKRVREITTKHLKFPSGLEVDVKIPAAAEMIDALITAGFDIQDLFSHTDEWKKEEQEARKEGKFYFNNTVYKMSEVLVNIIQDTDGEKVAEYVKYIPEDYKELQTTAVGFFMETPSLKSIETPQNDSESDTKQPDSGPTTSSTSPQKNGPSIE
jgi:hypothetical protein